MSTVQNNCPCPTSEIVNVPGAQGLPGTPGAAGSNGVNSFTVTNANFTIPATGSSGQVGVANSSWASINQTVFLSDGTNTAHFAITAVQASPPALTLKALGNTGDSSATTVIASGANVTPSGVQGANSFTPLATNNAATGGSQNLTTSPLQALATTLTLAGAAAHTYMLFCRLRLDYVGATFAANQTITLSIRRTNNTGTNIATTTLQTAVITTLTYSVGELCVIAIPYTTVGASDVIQPFISISSTPSAGSVNVVEASISALQLS
jgi:hypothetical protein